jgi:hypothetical protein
VRKLLILLSLVLLSTPAFGARVTIFNNFDLDAVAFVFCDTTDVPVGMTCVTGVADEDGWITVRQDVGKTFTVIIDALVVTGGLDITIQARVTEADGTLSGAVTLVNLINKTTATTDNQIIRIPDEVTQLRFGMEIGTADDGGDADPEDITVIYRSR